MRRIGMIALGALMAYAAFVLAIAFGVFLFSGTFNIVTPIKITAEICAILFVGWLLYVLFVFGLFFIDDNL